MLDGNLKYVLSRNMSTSFVADFISFFLGMYAHFGPADATSFRC